MKAYHLHACGPVSNLKLEEVPKPSQLAEHEVLIETKAIAINPVDTKCRLLDPVVGFIMKTNERPLILGWDVAGIVAQVGSAVTEYQVGDKVFGMIGFPGEGKAYAEYVVAPTNHIAKMASGQSFQEAAATTLAALTALQSMRSRVQKGDRVLIHAGSGGVGHFAIAMAKHYFEASAVIATSSAANKDFCLSMGADEHIDYKTQTLNQFFSENKVDFVLDTIGGETLEQSLKVLKDGGKCVTLLAAQHPASVADYCEQHKIALELVLVQSSADDMAILREMVEKGQLKPHVSKTFSFFDEMTKAHEAMESGRTVGKIVVLV